MFTGLESLWDLDYSVEENQPLCASENLAPQHLVILREADSEVTFDYFCSKQLFEGGRGGFLHAA